MVDGTQQDRHSTGHAPTPSSFFGESASGPERGGAGSEGPDDGSRGARSAPPWDIAKSAATFDRRRLRFHRRQRSSSWLIGDAREKAGYSRDCREDTSGVWVRPLRPARCRWRAASSVTVNADTTGEGSAHYSGLERCASVWACPVCAAVIRAKRADEIERAAVNAQLESLGLVFTTLTLRHKQADALALSLDLLLQAWRSVTSWRAWKDMAKRLGYIGAVRSTEVTYGANGWHPHSHFLMVFERPLSAAEVAAFEAQLFALWAKAVHKLGGRMPSRERGVDVKLVDGAGAVMANYLAKVQEKTSERRSSIGMEIARGDLKTGRAGSLNPFELLDADGEGTGRARALWIEFVTATKGRRAFTWSRGLRDRLLPNEEEKTDDEVIDETEAFEPVAVIDAATYDGSFRDHPDRLAEALELAELGDFDTLIQYVTDPFDPDYGHRVRFTATG